MNKWSGRQCLEVVTNPVNSHKDRLTAIRIIQDEIYEHTMNSVKIAGDLVTKEARENAIELAEGWKREYRRALEMYHNCTSEEKDEIMVCGCGETLSGMPYK